MPRDQRGAVAAARDVDDARARGPRDVLASRRSTAVVGDDHLADDAELGEGARAPCGCRSRASRPRSGTGRTIDSSTTPGVVGSGAGPAVGGAAESSRSESMRRRLSRSGSTRRESSLSRTSWPSGPSPVDRPGRSAARQGSQRTATTRSPPHDHRRRSPSPPSHSQHDRRTCRARCANPARGAIAGAGVRPRQQGVRPRERACGATAALPCAACTGPGRCAGGWPVSPRSAAGCSCSGSPPTSCSAPRGTRSRRATTPPSRRCTCSSRSPAPACSPRWSRRSTGR